MILVERINILLYLARFSGTLSGLSGYFAERAAVRKGGVMWGAYDDGTPCGAAFAEAGSDTMRVLYIAIADKHERAAIGETLLRACVQYADRTGIRRVFFQTADDTGLGCVSGETLQKLSFTLRCTQTTVIIHKTDQAGAEWDSFMRTRGSKIIKKLSEKGFAAKSFADLEIEDSGLGKFYARIDTDFPGWLDPRKCLNDLQKRHSMATVGRDGEPVAYCAVSSADCGQSAVFEYMAAAKNYIHSGVFFQCIVKSVESLIHDTRCQSFAYTFSVANSSMRMLAKNVFMFSGSTLRTTKTYQYTNTCRKNMKEVFR